ncbi:plasmid pRiA4b ORF-3 family protein [Leptolyngbya sp. AN03gr2]|uniref:plasmid pRiA4b ORF-3 family protein n=1 Tax=unclassified Leptolyngbya TaxID=2650499 RepID=UPI003D316CE5
MPTRKSSASASVYQIKVTLLELRPPIWRRVQVRSDITLGELHQIIQTAMGWTNSHLHLFLIQGLEYGEPAPEYDWEVKDERKVKINRVVAGEKFKFRYTYDMGDSWEHEILIEKILPAADIPRYGICVTGKRACPPEDCGGTWGYTELVETLRDPNHPEHESMLEWVGGAFNPEAFEPVEVNEALRQLR